jgi:hypothetical protein
MQSRNVELDRALIDQIGFDRVRNHFELSPQRLHNWRTRGIPYRQRVTFHSLALTSGIVPPPEFLAPLGIAA